jgi:hypothetical protein
VNDTQRILVIGLLMMSGAAMAYVLLNFGEGAFSREDRIAILVLSGHGEDSITGPGYGLYTKKGIPGVLFGLIAPICLFAGAAFVALGARRQD